MKNRMNILLAVLTALALMIAALALAEAPGEEPEVELTVDVLEQAGDDDIEVADAILPEEETEVGEAGELTFSIPGEEKQEPEQPEEEPTEEEPTEQEPTEEEPTEEGPTEEEPTEEEPVEGGTPVPNELTYTGEAQALVSADGAWLYSLDGGEYVADVPVAVNAGEYTVCFKPADDAGAEPQTLVVTIAKADVILVPPTAVTCEE